MYFVFIVCHQLGFNFDFTSCFLLLKLWMMKGQIHEELNHLDNAREAYKQGVSK